MAISVFLSTVSDEFRAYRDQLVHDLTRHDVAVKVQEDFKDLGGSMLDKLDTYIAHCDAVVHLVGDMCGSSADETQQRALAAKHSDLQTKLPPLGEALGNGLCLPYTQWEAWLALYHGRSLLIARAKATAPRGPKYAPDEASRAAQIKHLDRLRASHRYPGSEFGNADELAKQIAYTTILDLLVKDYAKKFAQQRDIAEGFIQEMSKRVAGDLALDIDGMIRAVRNAIEIYEKEIAGRPVETNPNDIVTRALSRAKEQVDQGQSRLAGEGLFRAAGEMQREERERRERYVAGQTVLYHRARDIALAAYDGDGAARAIAELARSIHGENGVKIAEFLSSEAQSLFEYGRDRGSNVHLVAAIGSRRVQLRLIISSNERGTALNDLGLSLANLGERESGTARLDEAVQVYHAALEERTREQVPLDWATTQSNLGNALSTLGQRESGTVRLEEAVVTHRAALEELTRERVPREWAATQSNLGNTLFRLGERESGTARLDEAVEAFRAALEELTLERAPLEWAATQNNLGNALGVLGGRENVQTRLEGAVEAFRAALKVYTREQVPLKWAATQTNLGSALRALGEREGGTAWLEEAVKAYHSALQERTRDRDPLGWALTQNNLGSALSTLGVRESRTARLEEAVVAFRAALEERTRGRVPLDWAATQNNLGNTLSLLGRQESGTIRLEEAVAAYREALEEWTRERVPLYWAGTQNNLGNALFLLSEREDGTGRLEEAVRAFRAALEEWTQKRVPLQWAGTQHNLGNALLKLGGQEVWTVRLEEAAAAFRAALEERTREKAPLLWATSYGSQGVAMMLIADRTNDSVIAETALEQIQAALETLCDGGHQQGAPYYEEQLPKAQAILDRLKGK
jgi:tetratricopeptide (TPR) repeat protein